MDGEHALGYARSRYNSSDLDRIQRQQRVIFAAMDKALNLDVLRNALDLWKEYQHTIDTDLNDVEVVGFAKLAADIPPDRISALSLGPCTVGAMVGDMSVQLFSKEGCKKIVDALFLDQELLAESAVVEVRDGSGNDIAEAAVDLLTNLGFPQGSVITSDPPAEGEVAKTEIVDYMGKTYSSGKLAEWLGVPPTAVRAATDLDAALRTTGADIVVVLGTDADVTGLHLQLQRRRIVAAVGLLQELLGLGGWFLCGGLLRGLLTVVFAVAFLSRSPWRALLPARPSSSRDERASLPGSTAAAVAAAKTAELYFSMSRDLRRAALLG